MSSVVFIDLHGIKHAEVEQIISSQIDKYWHDYIFPDFTIITGHSNQMREIVKKVAKKYKLEANVGF